MSGVGSKEAKRYLKEEIEKLEKKCRESKGKYIEEWGRAYEIEYKGYFSSCRLYYSI